MLLVFANDLDVEARRLVEAWREHDARLVGVLDLSRPGWRLHVGQPGEDVAVVGGEAVPASAISGVLTRRGSVWHAELHHVVAEDREYIAAEMTAFLASFLSRLSCPVVNRPSAVSLMGPSWTPEHWIAAAARAGLALPWATRSYPPPADAPPPTFALPEGGVQVTVVGDRCLGDVHPALAEGSLRLAALAGAELVAVQWSGPDAGATFLGAHLFPDVSAPDVAEALLARFRRAPTESA
jgi:hypothetical protein